MNIFAHPIVTNQFTAAAIGTFVKDPETLSRIVSEAVASFEFPENGQGFVVLPEAAKDCVLPGVALRTPNVGDYCLREHRGEISEYINRNTADLGQCDMVAAIVYTAEAFLADPQTSEEEKAAFSEAGYTHCWVTTLGNKGPKPPVGAWRFAVNLAGGNAAYANATRAQLVEEAREIQEYWSTWGTVAAPL